MNNSYFVHPSSIVDDGAIIGENTKIWHFCHISSNTIIGKDCNFGQNVFVAPNVKLGNGVKVQNNVSIYEGVECADAVFLGPSMVFTNVMNPRSGVSRKNEYKKTIVQEGVTIGANATIVCGITIGKYAFIGAGAVVTKNIPPFALVVGNPSRQIGWMSEKGEKLQFGDDQIAICPLSKEKYKLSNNKVEKIS
ncbi:MAG: N-acetyltransferase [Saprospiraceae bacterium]|nr:N-acetyltransferase [Saprospiraceae bacterium]